MAKRSKTWLADKLLKMPTREEMAANRFLRPFASRIMRSELWRFTRRSVPRGVALGMLVGIIIPFAQILFAALLSVSVRANVPLAAAMTFVSNPFTTPFIWVIAYKVGEVILRVDAASVVSPVNTAIERTEFQEFIQWLTGATLVTAFGLIVLSVVLAAVSYLVSSWFWRWRTGRKRQRLLRRRSTSLAPAE
ncbi:DUF2062 domain-containing protein [Tsuneonella sp. HG222]